MITSAALAVYLLELLKQFVGKLTNNPDFEFTPKVTAALLIVANAVSVLILAALGVQGNEFPVDWTQWVKTLIVAILGALVSSALYNFGYKPFKYFYNEFYSRQKAKSKAKK